MSRSSLTALKAIVAEQLKSMKVKVPPMKKRVNSPKKSQKIETRLLSAPVSMGPIRRYSMGLSDFLGVTMAYVAGYVYVANNGQIFFRDNSGLGLAQTPVPVAPADYSTGGIYIGQLYMQNIMSNFMRRRYHKIKAFYQSLTPSTTGTVSGSFTAGTGTISGGGTSEVLLAPIRSGGFDPIWVATSTPTGGLLQETVAAASGAISFPNWAEAEIDLTPYIAGGSGPKQNEFSINNFANIASLTNPVNNQYACPCALAVSGTLAGGPSSVNIGRVVFEVTVDLLDFVTSGMLVAGNNEPTVRLAGNVRHRFRDDEKAQSQVNSYFKVDGDGDVAMRQAVTQPLLRPVIRQICPLSGLNGHSCVISCFTDK
jgi:hypothetical protein